MKIGLVLEGGAMRGLFTCGVMDVLLENNIVFDGIIGTSAGCVFGCNYKSKQIGRAYHYNREYCNDPRFSGIRSLLTTGDIYNKQFAYHDVPFIYYPFDVETYVNNPAEFICVCTNVATGKPFYFTSSVGDQRDVEYMRASASMPLVSKIVHIDGYSLLDGGIADSIPLVHMQEIGYDKNVVILTQPRDYVKKPNKLLPLAKLRYHQYPKFLASFEDRHIRYNETLEYIRQEEKEGRIFVIAPEEALNISSVCDDPKEIDRVYELGRKAGIQYLQQLKDFMK